MTITYPMHAHWQQKRILALMAESDDGKTEPGNALECHLVIRGVGIALQGTLSFIDPMVPEDGIVMRMQNSVNGKPCVVEQYMSYEDIVAIAVVRLPTSPAPRIIRSA